MRIALLLLLSGFVAVYWQFRQPSPDTSGPSAPVDIDINVPPPQDDPAPDPPSQQTTIVPIFDPDEFGPASVEDVEAGLRAAQDAIDSGRLVRPEGNNALALLRGVLVLEPGNAAAMALVDQLEQILFDALHYSLIERDTPRAEVLLSALRSLSGQGPFPELDVLEAILHGQRVADAALSAARNAMESGQLVGSSASALTRLERARRADPGNPRIHEVAIELGRMVEDRIAVAVESRRFDLAQRWLDWLHRIQVDPLAIRFSEEQVDAAYAEQRRALELELSSRIADSSFDSAEAAIDQIRSLDPDRLTADDTRAFEDRVAFARIYGVYSPGDIFADRVDAANGPSMVVLPAGEFIMGAVAGDDAAQSAEEPSHRVTISRGFALSRHEIRVEDFRRFVDASGYLTDAEKRGYSFIYNENSGQTLRRRNITWRDDYSGRTAESQSPVVHVSWNDAQAYASWLTQATGWLYRLPSEAEFEYATRANASIWDRTVFWWGNGSPDQPVENLTGEEDTSPRYRRKWNRAFEDYADGHWGPAPVMSLMANGFGLFDMAGNVAEWTQDCWHDSYVRAPANGSAWVNRGCERRVARGSFWGGPPETARASYRIGYSMNQRGSAIGFRVARSLFRN